MKHLFLVKSWITYLVSRAIIREQGIDPSDCVLLAVRGFAIGETDIPVVRLPYGPGEGEPFPKLESTNWLNYFKTFPRLFWFDRFISKATGGSPYHYYSTNTRQRYNRVITTHRKCEGFSFLESGLISYRTHEETEAIYPSRKQKLLDRWFYLNRIGRKAYYDDNYHRVYGAGPLAFPGRERRVELKSVIGTDSIEALSIDVSRIDVVLVFDGLSAHRMISLASVVSATRRLFDHFREHGIERVHYKYHPAQTHTGEDRELDEVINEVAHGIQAERLPNSVILEELAYVRPGVHFYVNVSSVALYAAQVGSPVTSYARYIAESEPGFDATIEDLPASWKQGVEFL